MASTAEGGNPAHKMKRTGRALWKRNTLGVASSSSPAGNRTESQAGDVDDVPIPVAVNDILPPAGSYPSAPYRDARASSRTYANPNFDGFNTWADGETKAVSGEQKHFAGAEGLGEEADVGPTQEGRPSIPILRPQVHSDLTKASARRQSTEILETSETDGMAGLKRLPEEALLKQMTELNRPTSAGSRRRDSRSRVVSSSASASTSAPASASPSPSTEPLPSDPADAMDTGDGESPRTGLLTNADDESYYTYIEDDGSEQSTNNAPIPPGKERYDDGENNGKLPFVCPVRDCRVLSITMRALSSHFHGKHNRSLFNDNGDGTFSKVGDYVNEESSSPGIIVSCNLLSPGAPPPAVPEYSESQKKQLLSKKSSPMFRASAAGSAPPDTSKRSLRGDANNETMLDERFPKRPKTTPVPLPVQAATLMSSPLTVPSIPPPPPPPPIQSLEPPMTDVLRYLHRSLSPSQQVPTRIDIMALSKYKQVRNLPGVWWEHHHDKTLDPLQYACILAYLVGEAEEMNPCRRWKGLSRLSDPCVGLPRDLPAEARAAFSKSTTCIACQYQFCCYRLKNECEWANNDGKQDLNGTTEGAVSQQNHQSVEESDKVVVLEDEDVDGGASTRRSNGLSTSTKQPEQYSVQTGQKPSSAEVAEMEEMEDWEIAPGTMKDEKTNMNVGFSNAYMSNQHPITISPGLSFNVLIIKPGHTHHWPIEATKVRTCSVASGKISVKMGNDQAFKLGPNGLVVIRSGQSCMVANRLYSDAILHCTTFEDDF
ncbi:hypothetical protein TrVFT333_000328 [Trichoderma virens FT-333]|nr:hypothetical protein TrVFT333_000328 [Trichoderma virens FT-333]